MNESGNGCSCPLAECGGLCCGEGTCEPLRPRTGHTGSAGMSSPGGESPGDSYLTLQHLGELCLEKESSGPGVCLDLCPRTTLRTHQCDTGTSLGLPKGIPT